MNEIDWRDIERALHRIEHVDGGFSQAHRGRVPLANGRRVFVKIGVDSMTKQWAHKEVAVYRFLRQRGFEHVPELLAVNTDETAFVLEAFPSETGWDWQENWTEERLDKTLAVLDELANLTPQASELAIFTDDPLTEVAGGWPDLIKSPDLQKTLLAKLQTAGQQVLAQELDIATLAKEAASFRFRNDRLIHLDVRADNCAWNAKTKQIRLVDWNWAQLGDRRIDLAVLLVHAQKSGCEVLPKYTDRLDADALLWLAGFWLMSAAKPIWPGGPNHLRDFQLRAGVSALSIRDRL